MTPAARETQATMALSNPVPIPELEPGDRLTRDEFERRYEAMPNREKAELVEGVVYMPSPVRQRHHGRPHVHIATLLGHYESATPGVEVGDNTTIRIDPNNEVQPDAFLMIGSDRGGPARIDRDDYVEGAPELIAEVVSSSASIDLGSKLEVYRRNGVREYVVWRVLDRQIDWFVLSKERFEATAPAADGLIRGQVFPGLWLDAAALIRGDLARVLSVVGEGVKSADHAAFVTRLETAAPRCNDSGPR